MNVTGPIERLIMAKFNKQMKGKDVDVAYGGAVPADNRTFLINTLDNTMEKGLVAGQKYFHNDLFNVLASSPKVCHSLSISSNLLIFSKLFLFSHVNSDISMD